jgi:predicted PP-loop superfamily ATPase
MTSTDDDDLLPVNPLFTLAEMRRALEDALTAAGERLMAMSDRDVTVGYRGKFDKENQSYRLDAQLGPMRYRVTCAHAGGYELALATAEMLRLLGFEVATMGDTLPDTVSIEAEHWLDSDPL